MLTTVARVQSALGKTTVKTADSTLITKLIRQVGSLAERQTRRSLMYSDEHVETFDGDGEKKLYLKTFPVISIASVFVDEVEWFEDTDYRINAERGILYSERGWTTGFANIIVTYEAGWEADDDEDEEEEPEKIVPEDLESAIIAEVCARYRNMMDVEKPISAETGGVAETAKEFLDKKAAEVIALYRRMVI